MRLTGLFYHLATLGNTVPEVSFSKLNNDGKTRFQARNSLCHSDFGKIIEQSANSYELLDTIGPPHLTFEEQ